MRPFQRSLVVAHFDSLDSLNEFPRSAQEPDNRRRPATSLQAWHFGRVSWDRKHCLQPWADISFQTETSQRLYGCRKGHLIRDEGGRRSPNTGGRRNGDLHSKTNKGMATTTRVYRPIGISRGAMATEVGGGASLAKKPAATRVVAGRHAAKETRIYGAGVTRRRAVTEATPTTGASLRMQGFCPGDLQ